MGRKGPIFNEEPLEEIPLDPAPLAIVLCQIRFPRALNLDGGPGLAAFQDTIRGEYPVLRDELVQVVQPAPAGGVSLDMRTVHRFSTVDGVWIATLSQDALSLEVRSYTSRSDFVGRLERLFKALDGASSPRPVEILDRLGIRYVNRLVAGDAQPNTLEKIVRPEVFGALGASADLGDGQKLVSAAGQSHFLVSGFNVRCSWASLPAEVGIMPGVEALKEESWVLDVDCYVDYADDRKSFSPQEATATARRGAELAYDFFTWAMKADFIESRKAGG